MIFWDTSAVVPLLVTEPFSAAVTTLARSDPPMIVWWGTSVECLSALARRQREALLGPAETDAARRVLEGLQASWTEVLASEEVRAHAARLLLRQPLRAADALQLGAALTWVHGRPHGDRIATLDSHLAAAARTEGFSLALQLR